MLRDYLKYQGTIYLPEEDLQDALKEDGATLSLIKTGGTAYKEEDEEILKIEIEVGTSKTFYDIYIRKFEFPYTENKFKWPPIL